MRGRKSRQHRVGHDLRDGKKRDGGARLQVEPQPFRLISAQIGQKWDEGNTLDGRMNHADSPFKAQRKPQCEVVESGVLVVRAATR